MGLQITRDDPNLADLFNQDPVVEGSILWSSLSILGLQDKALEAKVHLTVLSSVWGLGV